MLLQTPNRLGGIKTLLDGSRLTDGYEPVSLDFTGVPKIAYAYNPDVERNRHSLVTDCRVRGRAWLQP